MHTLLPLAVGLAAGAIIALSFSRALLISLIGDLKSAHANANHYRAEALHFTNEYRKVLDEFIRYKQAVKAAEKGCANWPRTIEAREVERV